MGSRSEPQDQRGPRLPKKRGTPYRFELEGIKSDYDMMNAAFGHYGEMNKGWSGEDVKGFTKILANASKIHQFVQEQNK